MKEAILIWLLKALLSITREQWQFACDFVATAAVHLAEGRTKNTWVRENIFRRWPTLKPHVVDALVGWAVGWQKHIGKA